MTDDDGLLRRYLDDIAGYRLLSREEEQELGRRIQAGDEKAVQRLVESRRTFASVRDAKRYRGLGVPFLDLISEGNLLPLGPLEIDEALFLEEAGGDEH